MIAEGFVVQPLLSPRVLPRLLSPLVIYNEPPIWVAAVSTHQALEKRTSELKRSRAALEHKDEEKEEKENKERKRNSDAEDGKSEDEDRSKLPQVVGDESKTAILVDPRGWARERLAASLREKGKDLEQRTDRHGEEKPKTFDAPPIPPGRSRFCCYAWPCMSLSLEFGCAVLGELAGLCSDHRHSKETGNLERNGNRQLWTDSSQVKVMPWANQVLLERWPRQLA